MRWIVVLFVAFFLIGCASEDSGSSPSTDALVPAEVSFNGHTYVCIRYTTVNRGGLWCEREDK